MRAGRICSSKWLFRGADAVENDGRQHQFTFLGFAFRARKAKTKAGAFFTSFLPAISPEALEAKSADLRQMRIHRRSNLSLDDLARWLNPIAAGWSGPIRFKRWWTELIARQPGLLAQWKWDRAY